MSNSIYSIKIRYSAAGDLWIVLLKAPVFPSPVVLLIQPRLTGDAGGFRSISLLRKKLSYFGLL